MGPYGGPFGGGMGSFIGLVAMVALWAAMIWAVMAAFRSAKCRGWGGSHDGHCSHGCRGSGHHWHGGGEDPEQILARRYASGEIDEDEFHRRLDHLRSRDPETEKDGTWRP